MGVIEEFVVEDLKLCGSLFQRSISYIALQTTPLCADVNQG